MGHVEVGDTMPDGWQLWLDWHKVVAPFNHSEIEALKADQGKYLGGTLLGIYTLWVLLPSASGQEYEQIVVA